ncbi:hypothetical protein CU102_03525 [Phyllobacterium brassicacearum]|uniref:Activator of Hsp90 ATPase homologue 1/2-like C-terminal domain-containing protein n=1 Tax=Phyllobacterium brassicacearum TaxID=314235 RepID=A0A2P7BUM9_9HYPH|nr:SRPBCC domain-containing protein [Phyllobacterium brassicacearum]PSH70174.1 hypothetical protein CU102_03525 [Phyllobacterium brassicacearum]TDQ33945.1 uncharacterized protein YndB with AHSA1/START domain [Phyllobacterium brassicacearum]
MTHKTDASIKLTYELDAAPSKVWRALTLPEYVSRWLKRPTGKSGVPEENTPEPSIEIHLISADPHTRVRYSMKDNDAVSYVTFQIGANGRGGTTFSIVHELAMSVANNNRPQPRRAAA